MRVAIVVEAECEDKELVISKVREAFPDARIEGAEDALHEVLFQAPMRLEEYGFGNVNVRTRATGQPATARRGGAAGDELAPLRALRALRRLVSAAYALIVAWEGCQDFAALTEHYPSFLPCFDDEAFNAFVEWRDGVARALGEPVGRGEGGPVSEDDLARGF